MKKKITLILAVCFVLISFAITHIPLSMILHIDTDNVTEADCVWFGDDALEIFKNNYAGKIYRLYYGRIGSTGNAEIKLYNNENKIAEFTDLGCLGLIQHKGIIFQERGCYADEGFKHFINTIISSSVFVLPVFIAAILAINIIEKLLRVIVSRIGNGADNYGL